MKNILIILVAAFILFVSCEKKKKKEVAEEIEETQKEEVCEANKITGAIHGDYLYFELKLKNKLYDTLFLSEIEDYRATFHYDAGQKLIKVEYFYDNKIREYEEYFYNGGQISKVNYYALNNTTNDFDLKKYKRFYFNGSLLVKAEDFKITNELSYYEEFKYDGNENVINSNSFTVDNNDTIPRYRLVFTYDNKKASPMSNLLFFDYLFTKNKNNVISRKYESFNPDDMTWAYSEFNSFSYEYNNKEYPVKMTSDDNNFLNYFYFDCE